jgi:hypothetical protein
MTPKAVLAQMLEELEADYRYWLIEEINLERGIDDIETKVNRYEAELGAERAANFRLRLSRTRDQHRAIEAKIRGIRLRLDELRARLNEIP